MGTLDCGHELVKNECGIGVGYAVDSDDRKICYECCAEQDRQWMRDYGKIVLYLSMMGSGMDASGGILGRATQGHTYYGKHKVGNWPGTLELPVHSIKVGGHNIAGNRYDFWFSFEGTEWHGVQYGDNTQIAHCKRLATQKVA